MQGARVKVEVKPNTHKNTCKWVAIKLLGILQMVDAKEATAVKMTGK
jgi:hypothetical protein